MAHFRLTRAFAYGGHRLAAGTVIADIAVPGETSVIWWPGLNSQTLGQGFIPLDASAVGMKNASVYWNEVIQAPTGADSIG
jgi:hypothetical protein